MGDSKERDGIAVSAHDEPHGHEHTHTSDESEEQRTHHATTHQGESDATKPDPTNETVSEWSIPKPKESGTQSGSDQ